MGIQDYLKRTTNEYFTANHDELHDHEVKEPKHGHGHGHGGPPPKQGHGHGHSHGGPPPKEKAHGHGHSHGGPPPKAHGHGHSHGGDDKGEDVDDHSTPEIKLKVVQHKLELANEIIAKMRINFTKELIHLQETMQMSTHIKMHGYQYIEVKYFDSSDILNDDVRFILNSKIRDMRNKCEMLIVNKDKDLRNLN